MTVHVAESAGFCFGVNRAVDAVYELLDSGKQVCTLGPIIHNPQMVEALSRRGVKIVSEPSEVPPGATLVIRSHGVPESMYRLLEDSGVPYHDATCPFVSKIHRIVAEQSEAGKALRLSASAVTVGVLRMYFPLRKNFKI